MAIDLALPLYNSVTLGKSLNISESVSPFNKGVKTFYIVRVSLATPFFPYLSLLEQAKKGQGL